MRLHQLKLKKKSNLFDVLDKNIIDILTTAFNQFVPEGFKDIACIFTASP